MTKYKISFAFALFIFVFAGIASAQTDRISADGSQSVSTDDTSRERQKPQGKTKSTAEQFKRFTGILPTGNKMSIMAVRAEEELGTILCRQYQENFAPLFDDNDFAKTHMRLSADEFSVAYFLMLDGQVSGVFIDSLKLAVERASVKAGGTEMTYEKILAEKVFKGDKSKAKKAVKDARNELEKYAKKKK